MREKMNVGYRYNCDGDECYTNYESSETDPRQAWRETAAHGWVLMDGGEGELNHLCPTCKKLVGG